MSCCKTRNGRNDSIRKIRFRSDRNLRVLGTILKMEGFRYWICALLMISLTLQNLIKKRTRIWIFNIIFRLHQGPSTLTNGFCVTKACPFYVDSATSKRLSPQLLALVHHTVPFTKMILPNWTWNIVDCCAWLWATLQTLVGHHPGTRFYMGGTTKYKCCRTTLD